MLKKNRKYYWIDFLILLIFILILIAIWWFQSHPAKPIVENNSTAVISENCDLRNKIDGRCYTGEEPLVYAVMIDNQQDARPTSGLSQASLVYEAIAEAPITRFLAVFSLDKKIAEIGPVRSVRPYYVNWAQEFNCSLLHVGGSPEALSLISKSYDFDLNQFNKGQYFWRDAKKSSPHNVYTSSDLVNRAITDRSWQVGRYFDSWLFKNDQPVQADAVKDITVSYANSDFLVEWKYDATKNDYLRYEAGRIHVDQDGTEIRAKNVAVMYVTSSVIDSVGRRKTQTTGTGNAVVFQDGNAITGTWQRQDLNSRTRFFDANGTEISFNHGMTWIEVVPSYFPKVAY